MKNIAKRFVTFLMACLILFTSSGFGLVENSCSMRTKKTYSFVNKDACKGCNKHKSESKNKTTVSRDKCCESKQVKLTENLSDSVVNIAGKSIKNSVDSIEKSVTYSFYQAIYLVNTFTYNNSDQPYTLFGIKLLHFIGLLRL